MPDGYVECIAISPNSINEIIAVFSNYGVQSLWHSTNGGTNWTNISGDLEQNVDGSGDGTATTWATILPYSGTTTYYVGTLTGLYSTTTLSGTTTDWTLESSDLIGNVPVHMVLSRAADGQVFVATHGKGVFSGQNTVTSTDEQLVGQDRFEASVRPNPIVSNNATLVYNLPKPTQITIEILDVNGRLVDSYNEGQRPKGLNSIDLQTGTWAKGLYYYRLRAADGSTTSGKLLKAR
jgi:Secretion system C-terminal sorting domain